MERGKSYRKLDQEVEERKHKRRVQGLQNLYLRLRSNSCFLARSQTAEGFWESKDKVDRESGKNGLDGWIVALEEWWRDKKTSLEVTPQCIDIIHIACECSHWSFEDRDRANSLAQDSKSALEARFSGAKA